MDSQFIDFIIGYDQRLSSCSGGFTVEGLLKSKIKEIKGDFQVVQGLSIRSLFESYPSLKDSK